MPLINGKLIVPGDFNTTLHYAAAHFVTLCRDAIADHHQFAVALSGGSTPKAIYHLLCQPPYCQEIDWDKIHLFWSDERSVPPTHPESNYNMAMQAGFSLVPLPPSHIHRMVAESNIHANTDQYEKKILTLLEDRALDLVMLGMGEDGHTASLFPDTEGMKATDRYVIANYTPQKKTWRMTLTFNGINSAENTVFYVLGKQKAKMLSLVFNTPPTLPCQLVGSADHPALWIADRDAASLLK